MTVEKELRIAEMLCTRLCHDITGPIGAIANGIEFLDEDETKMQEQALELISNSASQAIARLQFYRRAYGKINADGEHDIEELQKTISDFFADGKITIEWSGFYKENPSVSISFRSAKLLLNLLIIVSSALIRGGVIGIAIKDTDGISEITVSGTGKTVKWEAETDAILQGNVVFEALTPKTIQLYTTHLLAHQLHKALNIHSAPDKIEIIAHRIPLMIQNL